MKKYAIIMTKSDLVKGASTLSEYAAQQENKIIFADSFEEACRIFAEKSQEVFPESYCWLEDPICAIDDGVFETDEDTELSLRTTGDILAEFCDESTVPTEGVSDLYVCDDEYEDETWSVDIKNNTLLYKKDRSEIGQNFVLYTNILKMDDSSKEYFIVETDMCSDSDDTTDTYASLRLIPIE